MSTRRVKFLFWLAAIALITACVVPSVAAPLPTANPQEVGNLIAQTAGAASTQTARAMPTLTPTVTVTPTRPTETASPTATSTIIFILSSPTKIVPPTLVIVGGGGSSSGGGSGSGSGSSADNFACQVVSVNPANGTAFKARDDFDATWRVKNTGAKDWGRTSVDFIYLTGDKLHKVAGYDLPKDVDAGDTIDLIVDMVAPKNSGTYSTTWTLAVGSKNFCSMSITIVVK